MVRLKDIAAQAGVSVMTVSKVMHDAEDISAATKVRVRAIADRMGYIPDTAAQGLRTRTTRMFGLVIPAMTNPIFARVVMAIEEQAHEMGYDIILAHSHNSVEREEKCIRRLLCRRVNGIFLVPVYRAAQTAPAYEELLQRAVPTVILGQRAPFCSRFASVETDDVAGAVAITRHLIDLGRVRIGVEVPQRVDMRRRVVRRDDDLRVERLLVALRVRVLQVAQHLHRGEERVQLRVLRQRLREVDDAASHGGLLQCAWAWSGGHATFTYPERNGAGAPVSAS